MSKNKTNPVVAAFAALLLVGGLGACSSSKATTPQSSMVAATTTASSPAAPASPSTDHVAPTTAANSPSCTVTMRSPSNGFVATNSNTDVNVAFNTCPSQTVAIFDSNPPSGGFLLDDTITTVDGTTTFTDTNVGDSGKDENLTITIVLVNTACANALSHIAPDGDNDVYVDFLPGTCVVAAQVSGQAQRSK